MVDRGENSFVKFPRIAAKIYKKMTAIKPIEKQFQEITDRLPVKKANIRLLDIGTGPGNLLRIIHEKYPDIELFGLDISRAMIKEAKSNLHDIPVELIEANIASTNFEDGMFDLIITAGSFYLWNKPLKCLFEINRILKDEGKVYLYESYSDYDDVEFEHCIKENLKDVNFFKRRFSKTLLKRQYKMTYSIFEYHGIFSKSVFAETYQLHPITLSNLPTWVEVILSKP